MSATPRILIIDDSAVVRLYYRHMLQTLGCAADEAMNGIEALEKVFRTHYDACIVDVNMPLMDGFAFLTQLRRHPELRALPALVTTTQETRRDRAAALRAGANAFLVKPVAEAEFTAAISALLHGPAQSSGPS